jgi:hypothetical protein|eukprot:COSAG02_NODE_4517_length_5272_cov_2.579354_2_plen_113_part_00
MLELRQPSSKLELCSFWGPTACRHVCPTIPNRKIMPQLHDASMYICSICRCSSSHIASRRFYSRKTAICLVSPPNRTCLQYKRSDHVMHNRDNALPCLTVSSWTVALDHFRS